MPVIKDKDGKAILFADPARATADDDDYTDAVIEDIRREYEEKERARQEMLKGLAAHLQSPPEPPRKWKRMRRAYRAIRGIVIRLAIAAAGFVLWLYIHPRDYPADVIWGLVYLCSFVFLMASFNAWLGDEWS
ncbi:MAG TPA: hypothetical protein VGJ20_28360 [Xanthobacteraceae bacterium]|jgi:hypothetical protein